MDFMIIFWHLIFAVVGFLVGILVGQRIKFRGKAPAPAEPVAVKPAEEEPSLLKAGRSPKGRLWLEVGGRRLTDKADLDASQRQGLLNLMLELRPWLEVEKVATPVIPLPPPNPAAATSAPVAPVAPAPAATPVAPIARKEKKDAPPAPAMKTILEQINDVLQARLALSPFKDRGIELQEGLGGTVVVQDGLNHYEGIDCVPDAEVKELIRTCIAEWEKTAK